MSDNMDELWEPIDSWDTPELTYSSELLLNMANACDKMNRAWEQLNKATQEFMVALSGLPDEVLEKLQEDTQEG